MTYAGPTALYIDGEWTESVDGGSIETIDPATEEPYATVACVTDADVSSAVEAAESAAAHDAEWRTTDPSDRAAALGAMADEIEAMADEIVLVESHDNGKTPFEAQLDVEMVIDTFRYYAGWADKLTGESIPVPGNRLDYTLREPLGVTAHIAPWNYPFQLAGRSLAAALSCGNTVVVKPSKTTPLSALHYGTAAEAAGLPDGVVNVVPGRGSEAGSALVDHPGVDHVAFTGSTGVGKGLMSAAADNVTGVTLELGGKGPNIVFPDADLDAAAKGVHYGIFMNCGQMCWAGSRLLVHEDIHDEVVDTVVERAEATPLGSGIDDDGQVGPAVSESHREEVFGPVLCVIEFSDFEEAMAIANDSPFGLSAGVWTDKLSTAHDAASRLEYGMVSVNEYPQTFPQTPSGGSRRADSAGSRAGHRGGPGVHPVEDRQRESGVAGCAAESPRSRQSRPAPHLGPRKPRGWDCASTRPIRASCRRVRRRGSRGRAC